DPSPTALYPLSLHDALPISGLDGEALQFVALGVSPRPGEPFSVEDFVSVPLLGIDEERGALETGAPIPEGHSVSFTLRDGMGAQIGRATSELQSLAYLVCRL